MVIETPKKITEDYPTRKPEALTKQQTIKMNDIFSNEKQRTIIIGSAGVGKSSLAQKITIDWAEKKYWNEQFDFVFHFRCRDLAEQCDKDLTLKELLTDVHTPNISLKFNRDEYIKTTLKQNNRILIILDGLDELPTWDKQARKNKFTQYEFPIDKETNIADLVNGLIQGFALPGVNVLTTTQPMETLSSLLGVTSILILGFNEKSVKKCIKGICQCYPSDSEKNDKLYLDVMDFLRSNSTIQILCVVPFLCTLFTVVALESLEKEGTIQIANMTQLVILAIRYLIKRRTYQTNKKQLDNVQWNFTHYKRQKILFLSEIAARFTVSAQLKTLFTEESIDGKGEVETGLLECFEERNIGNKPQTYYSFIHLLIQEFLTAVHVCINKVPNTFFSQVEPNSQRLDNVHLFMAGLLGDKDKGREFLQEINPNVQNLMTIQELLPVISSQSNNNKLKRLQLIRCAHEGQMSDMICDIRTLVMEEDGKRLDLNVTRGGLLPHHLASVGWFILESQCVESLE